VFDTENLACIAEEYFWLTINSSIVGLGLSSYEIATLQADTPPADPVSRKTQTFACFLKIFCWLTSLHACAPPP
jgi:hypothetical protein